MFSIVFDIMLNCLGNISCSEGSGAYAFGQSSVGTENKNTTAQIKSSAMHDTSAASSSFLPLSAPLSLHFTLADSPLHISHIRTSITDYFSFTDLLSRSLVNHSWHNSFVPILWADIITVRAIAISP